VNYVLDSTVLIDHARAFQPGVEILRWLFEGASVLYTCDVVACEVLSRGDTFEQQAAQTLLDALEYVALDPDGARWAGDRRRERIEAGSGKPSVGDALIAAVAWRLEATVVTRNARDFEPFGIPVLEYGASLPRAAPDP
jgi:predicted nucleic acid-binding protein